MRDGVFTNDISAVSELRRDAGFSLIEWLAVAAIVAILVAIAAPSFRYVTTANRASSEINGLLGDMQFARAEAIREGQTVTICATNDGATCAGAGTAWQTGWLVFSDIGPNPGVISVPPDSVLKMQKAFSSQDTLQADNGVNLVTFGREGFAAGLPSAVSFRLHDSTSNAQYTRCLSLTIIGALSTQIGGATTAENTPC